MNGSRVKKLRKAHMAEIQEAAKHPPGWYAKRPRKEKSATTEGAVKKMLSSIGKKLKIGKDDEEESRWVFVPSRRLAFAAGHRGAIQLLNPRKLHERHIKRAWARRGQNRA